MRWKLWFCSFAGRSLFPQQQQQQQLRWSLGASYRVFDVTVSVSEDPGAGAAPGVISEALVNATRRRLSRKRGDVAFNVTRVVRKSMDTRKRLREPRWVYVVDVDVDDDGHARRTLKTERGKLEKRVLEEGRGSSASSEVVVRPHPQRKVVVVGAGPAGLFCAKELAANGVSVTLLERGQGVERRGADIGKLIHRRVLDPNSNFAYGEGGAGTWSDGKLTTRIGRNELAAREVLETFVDNGAPESILVSGAPHLGTDTLVRVLKNMRHSLTATGLVDLRFRARVDGLDVRQGRCEGVHFFSSDFDHQGDDHHGHRRTVVKADAVVVAAGHSADDTYAVLLEAGAKLVPKGLAVGFRVEHPQALVNRAAYGSTLAARVRTGRKRTDAANLAYVDEDSRSSSELLKPSLPVASYRLASTTPLKDERSAYSFCCCPGGQIVPASTDPELVVVNGMSFSRRDSPFANAALVVTVAPDDALLEPYAAAGPLAALRFQRDAERKAALLGGGGFVAPVTRLTDFLDGRPRSRRRTEIPSSYRLGVKEANCRDCFPDALNDALAAAVVDDFERAIPGFICDDAILHGVETRTSAPCQVERHKSSCESTTLPGLFPCGEGAGHAGGIVSAAVDGIRVARAILNDALD